MKDNTTKNGKDQSQAFAKTEPSPTANTNQNTNNSATPQSTPKVNPSDKNEREKTSKV